MSVTMLPRSSTSLSTTIEATVVTCTVNQWERQSRETPAHLRGQTTNIAAPRTDGVRPFARLPPSRHPSSMSIRVGGVLSLWGTCRNLEMMAISNGRD